MSEPPCPCFFNITSVCIPPQSLKVMKKNSMQIVFTNVINAGIVVIIMNVISVLIYPGLLNMMYYSMQTII